MGYKDRSRMTLQNERNQQIKLPAPVVIKNCVKKN